MRKQDAEVEMFEDAKPKNIPTILEETKKPNVEEEGVLRGCICVTGTFESKAEGPIQSMTKAEMDPCLIKIGK